MNIIINEPFTKYALKIYQGQKWRYASMTDVKFINKDYIIAAHRYACKIYSIHLLNENNEYEIIDTCIMTYNNHPYQTESFVICNNKIYMLSFSNILTIIDILPNYKLKQIKSIQLNNNNISFHGIALKANHIYLTPSNKSIGTEYILSFNIHNETITNVSSLGENIRVKGLSFLPNDRIIVLINYKTNTSMIEKGHIFDGAIRLYTNDFTLLDAIEVPQTHFDMVINKENVFYATGADVENGYIYKGIINDDKITNLTLHEVNNFPHGIDILEDRIIYTSYLTSGIHSFQES